MLPTEVWSSDCVPGVEGGGSGVWRLHFGFLLLSCRVLWLGHQSSSEERISFHVNFFESPCFFVSPLLPRRSRDASCDSVVAFSGSVCPFLPYAVDRLSMCVSVLWLVRYAVGWFFIVGASYFSVTVRLKSLKSYSWSL